MLACGRCMPLLSTFRMRCVFSTPCRRMVVVVDLFIQLYTDPEWILTVAGHFYIYDHNPVTGPPFSSSISSFLLPTSASSSDSHWRLLSPAQSSCRKGKTALLLWLMCVIFYLLTATCSPKGHGSSLPLPSRTVADFP